MRHECPCDFEKGFDGEYRCDGTSPNCPLDRFHGFVFDQTRSLREKRGAGGNGAEPKVKRLVVHGDKQVTKGSKRQGRFF